MSTVKVPLLETRVRTMQIIKISLIMGVTMFAAYILLAAPPPQQAENPMVWMMVALGAIAIVARLIVPSVITKSTLRRIATGNWPLPGTNRGRMPVPTTDEEKLLLLYQMKMIIGSALLEGGAFANLVGCLTTGHIASWVMSGILWLGLMVDFPTKLSVERWVESKLAWISDERRLTSRP